MFYKLLSLTHFFKRGISCPAGSFVWIGLVCLSGHWSVFMQKHLQEDVCISVIEAMG